MVLVNPRCLLLEQAKVRAGTNTLKISDTRSFCVTTIHLQIHSFQTVC